MLRTRVIPCLLLKEQGLVKTVKFRNPKYLGDPINIVKIFNDKEADELIFLDITATIENRRPPVRLLADIASECFMPLAYGGGIRTIEDIREILTLGVEKVIINSYAVENPAFIKKAAGLYGSQSIVVSIDVKKTLFGKHEIFTCSGGKAAGTDPVSFASLMEEMGAGELFVNSIDRDGTMLGYDLDIIKRIARAVNIPVIACGGAGKVADFTEAAQKAGASAVAAGSLFVFQGRHRAVLISFLSEQERQQIFDKVDNF
ncbi:MAG: AglZ/HisF2 family acetamidino modification protein [Thermodesulfovibrionales bacterium]